MICDLLHHRQSDKGVKAGVLPPLSGVVVQYAFLLNKQSRM